MNKKPSGAALRPVPTNLGAAVLNREAERLLASLEADGAFVFPDPTAEAGLIVRRRSGSVSLGAGRFSREAGRTLHDAGLVERLESRPDQMVISRAGMARLARSRAPDEVQFLAQHLELTRDRRDATTRLRDVSESPLAWMARRRGRDGKLLIDAAAFEAGERLRHDLERAGMVPAMTPQWGAPRVDGSGPRDPASATDAMVAARQRVERALAGAGSEMSGLLIDLCGFLKGLETLERERGWPPRSAKVVVRIALDRLAEHYGIGREAVGPERSRSRLWRAPQSACM